MQLPAPRFHALDVERRNHVRGVAAGVDANLCCTRRYPARSGPVLQGRSMRVDRTQREVEDDGDRSDLAASGRRLSARALAICSTRPEPCGTFGSPDLPPSTREFRSSSKRRRRPALTACRGTPWARSRAAPRRRGALRIRSCIAFAPTADIAAISPRSAQHFGQRPLWRARAACARAPPLPKSWPRAGTPPRARAERSRPWSCSLPGG